MYTDDLDAHGAVVLSAGQKRRQVAHALRGRGIGTELANELAILGGLDGTSGDALHTLAVGGTILDEALARQAALSGAAGLLVVPGMALTAQEAFAHVAAKGFVGTTGVFLGSGLTPPITHHFTSVGCEARCELAIVALNHDLGVSVSRLGKAWAFAEACWSRSMADRLQPRTASGVPMLDETKVPLRWWQHVAAAIVTTGGVVVLDPSLHASGPLSLADWHQLLGVPNNYPGQTQETAYGQPPILGGQPRGRLGYATLGEPLTRDLCFADADRQMQIAVSTAPIPHL